MLKYTLILFFLFNLSSIHGQVVQKSFNHKITYQLDFVKDSLNKDKVTTEFMELLIGDETSIFRSVTKGREDSLNYIFLKKYEAWEAAGSVGSISYGRPLQTDFKYMIIHTQDEIVYQERLQDLVNYWYVESESPVWQLTGETQQIEDFMCQKATTEWGNRKWEAWFTTEVPIQLGPYMFNGLPGLIVHLKDHTNSWVFELASISNTTQPIFVMDWMAVDNRKNVDKAEFYKTKKYLAENFFDINFSNGKTRFASEQIKIEARTAFLKKAKEDNNWIELFP